MVKISDIIELRGMLRQLQKADVQFRVFGSKQHRYQLAMPISKDELTSFESDNLIQLPEDYRLFLEVVGNGGAGPYYGLEPLNTFGRDLSQPFPFTKRTDTLSDEELDHLPDEFDHDEYPGVLEFCHQGCAIFSYLVVNGPTYGTIWDGREDFFPTGLNFSEWYRRWLERALRLLSNERLIPQIKIGMSQGEVIAEVGGTWRARQVQGLPGWLFESPDIPAQLELNARGLVVKINPWLFI